MINVASDLQIIDSHCHLDILRKKQDIALVLEKARQSQVIGMLNVSVDLETIDRVIQQTEMQSNIWASVGVHPCHCEADQTTQTITQEFATIERLVKEHSRVIAIGETGLDFFHTKYQDSLHQFDYFIRHIELAKQLGYPIIIHCRNAKKEIIQTLQKYNAQDCGGVMHCFAEDWDTAKAALDMGFYISFSGILTYPKSTELRAVAKRVPTDRLLVETDSPYLSPQAVRSKPNQPAHVVYTLETLAQTKNQTTEEMARVTTANFLKCFRANLS